jgi:hypothetical protein
MDSPMEGREIAGQTLSWMHSPEQPPKPKPLNVHPLIRQAILELATRYRPNVSADIEPFEAKIALLTKDLAHANPQALKAAADEWARRERWLPKASELIELIRESRGPRGKEVDLAAKYNARLAAEGKRGMKWVYDAAGQLKLISTRQWEEPSREMVPPRDVPPSRQPYAD